jgi:hypothetical protein
LGHYRLTNQFDINGVFNFTDTPIPNVPANCHRLPVRWKKQFASP